MYELKHIELLAPAGDKNALKAAVNNGADAVYLGAKTFSARESATNFTQEELLEVIKYCHLNEVRVYAAVNTLLRDKEIEEAIELIEPLYDAGVDSIIMQDFGAAEIIKSIFPGLPLHASTQLGVHNASGAKWAENFGFTRAILSREVTIEGIREISKNSNIELEAFIHGALCSSFSGQCLFSSFLGGRSGNRGRCAQPCRLFYELYDNDKKLNHGYLLSTKEMCTIGALKDMIGAGISSFKIEGRARRSEYVSLTVRSYRQVIDAILENIDIDEDVLINDLMRMYNRGGFSTGYYYGNRTLTAVERPNNWGVLVGNVWKTDGKKMLIKSKYELTIGDGLEFIGEKSKGSCAISDVVKIEQDLYAINALPGVLAGDRVYRNTDAKLLQREKKYTEDEKHIELIAEFNAKIGERALLCVTDDRGNRATVVSKQTVEKSLKTFDLVKEAKRSIRKTGGTVFEFSQISINADEESWLPISEIANMRRQSLDMITQKRLSRFRLYEAKKLDITYENAQNVTGKNSNNRIIIVQTGNIEHIKSSFEKGTAKVFFCPENFDEATFKKIKDFGENWEIYIKIPTFMLYKDEKAIKDIFDKYAYAFSGAVISHITQVELAKKYFKNIIAGSEVNVFNSASYRYLQGKGINECVLSPELNIAQAGAIEGINKYIIVQGKITLMNLPHCPIYEYRKCNCSGLDDVYLKDRKEYMLPLKRNKIIGCNVRVLNGIDLCALPIINEIKNTNINGYVIIDEDYKKSELNRLINAYKQAISGVITKKEVDELSKGTTRGHLKKGVF